MRKCAAFQRLNMFLERKFTDSWRHWHHSCIKLYCICVCALAFVSVCIHDIHSGMHVSEEPKKKLSWSLLQVCRQYCLSNCVPKTLQVNIDKISSYTFFLKFVLEVGCVSLGRVVTCPANAAALPCHVIAIYSISTAKRRCRVAPCGLTIDNSIQVYWSFTELNIDDITWNKYWHQVKAYR